MLIRNSPPDRGRLGVHLFQCPLEAPWAPEGPVGPVDQVDPPGPDLPVWRRQSRQSVQDTGSPETLARSDGNGSDALRLKIATEANAATEAKASNRR